MTHNIGQLLVSSILSDNAVPAGSVRFVPMQFPAMAHALQEHHVAAAWEPDPFITESEENVGAIPLADSNQGTTENLPIAGYMVTASWLKKYPNTAAAFRRALVQAQTIATNDPAAVQQGMQAFAKVPAITAAVEANPQFPTQMNATLLGRLAKLMLHFNMIDQDIQRKPDARQVTGAQAASVSAETSQSSAALPVSRAYAATPRREPGWFRPASLQSSK